MTSTYNEYSVVSNNSINDNKYNAQKASKTFKIKRVLKPLLKMLRQRKQKPVKQEHFYECDQNSANEELESRIFTDIDTCNDDAAVWVYDDDDIDAVPVFRGQQYIPVHFARTEAGTFFWTTVNKPADCDFVKPTSCYTECQTPCFQSNRPDRWVQA